MFWESKDLFEPFELGPIKLANRIIMAPLTRSRAGEDGVPTDIMATYYEQRSSAGLIISEATNISREATGYYKTPGIYTSEQVKGWKKITDSVHQAGGKIFCQLWHVGRISHKELQPEGQPPVSASAIQAEDGKAFTAEGIKPSSTPRALETDEIPRLINDYVNAAEKAKEAGFDGVEIHSANGYLLHQFISSSSNRREDQYGGNVINNCRLTLEVTEAVCKVWGSDKVGIRLAPVSPVNGMHLDDPQRTYNYLAEKLSEMDLAYLHAIEGVTGGDRDFDNRFSFHEFRQNYRGTYMGNNNYDLDLALEKRDKEKVDLICFGRPFISNPDLVERFKTGADLAPLDQDTLYGGGKKGYIDYPTMDQQSM